MGLPQPPLESTDAEVVTTDSISAQATPGEAPSKMSPTAFALPDYAVRGALKPERNRSTADWLNALRERARGID